MPMTKKGLLPNAYRFIHIAADGFEDRILKGRLYHDSREGGMPFIGLFGDDTDPGGIIR